MRRITEERIVELEASPHYVKPYDATQLVFEIRQLQATVRAIKESTECTPAGPCSDDYRRGYEQAMTTIATMHLSSVQA
ncbi:MAG: hypothetical protein NVSMB21_25080 [Vulcanimicrobiaceae bacterium]